MAKVHYFEVVPHQRRNLICRPSALQYTLPPGRSQRPANRYGQTHCFR